jgi:biopolymer transport protein ExbD
VRQRRRWLRDEGERLSMTPMIDVTFLLLLFFLCTLQIKTLERKIPSMLPKDAGAVGPPSALEDILITLRVDPIEARRAIRFKTIGHEYADLEALRDRLRRIPRDPAPAIRVRCREGILYGEVVSLLDMLLLDDWTDIGFAPAPRN